LLKVETSTSRLISGNFNVILPDMNIQSDPGLGSAASSGRFRVPTGPNLEGLELDFTSRGSGAPLLLIHGGLLTGWFDLLCQEPALSERYRLLSFHRPGYGRSSVPSGPVGLGSQSACCLALMRHLDVERAHVVGHSIGGCIALQLALDAPDAVASLVLLEPPVLTAVTDRAGARVIGESAQRWQQGDSAGALDLFMKGVVDPDYQKFFDEIWPAGKDELARGGKPFFETDQPSNQAWQFGAAEAARIAQPVLLVIGDGSDRVNPFRSQVQSSLLEWLPNAEPFTLPHATHLLPLQNPSGLAGALVDFYGRIDA
jgi:pimeloyl-ACP methyl ester carboxylesterase